MIAMTERSGSPRRSQDMKLLRPVLFLATALALVGVTLQPTAAAGAVPTEWAPAETATIHPGVQTDTAGSGQCTANFIFENGVDVFIGQAAHCAGTGAATETDGCLAESLPLGTRVDIDGASQPGTLVYSSWLTMQAYGETDEETCAYNDFALVRIDPADVDDVNPSVPFWGGPTSVGGPTAELDEVYSYGNSSLRLGLTVLSPKSGYSLGTTPGGWSHTVYTVTPGIPGDSGSGFLNASGQAIGTLSTVAILPFPASNGVSDLAHELNYASSHGFPVQLVPGTVAFTPGLPIG